MPLQAITINGQVGPIDKLSVVNGILAAPFPPECGEPMLAVSARDFYRQARDSETVGKKILVMCGANLDECTEQQIEAGELQLALDLYVDDLPTNQLPSVSKEDEETEAAGIFVYPERMLTYRYGGDTPEGIVRKSWEFSSEPAKRPMPIWLKTIQIKEQGVEARKQLVRDIAGKIAYEAILAATKR